MAQEDVIDVPRLFLVGAISVILTCVAIVGVQALYHAFEQAEHVRKEEQHRPAEIQVVTEEQRGRLNEWRVLERDAAAGPEIVAIPIDRAMEMVRKEQRAGD